MCEPSGAQGGGGPQACTNLLTHTHVHTFMHPVGSDSLNTQFECKPMAKCENECWPKLNITSLERISGMQE